MRKVLIILTLMMIGLAVFSVAHGQTKATADTCFTTTEVVNIANTIKSLQNRDTVQAKMILELKAQTGMWRQLHAQDSVQMSYKDLKIAVLNEKIDFYKDYTGLVKPKWYDSKFVWFMFGSLMVLASYFVYKGAL